jgi:hypothetical protein
MTSMSFDINFDLGLWGFIGGWTFGNQDNYNNEILKINTMSIWPFDKTYTRFVCNVYMSKMFNSTTHSPFGH